MKEELYLQQRDNQWRESQRELRADTRQNLKEALQKDMMKGVSAKDENLVKKQQKKGEYMLRDVNRMFNKSKSLKNKAMSKQQKLQMLRARHALKKTSVDDAFKVVDLLKGSALIDNKAVVSDLIKFDGVRNWKVRTGGQQLPSNTLDCFYESLLQDRLRYTSQVFESLDKQLNEVKPLLFAVLKMALTLKIENENKTES